MIDRELREIDAILENNKRNRFAARRVLGADLARGFSTFVRTEGWEPVDAKLKVSDVPRLVSLLGGAHLYGHDQLVPIRELLQNASDAVQARRLIESGMTSRGKAKLSIREDNGSYWLEVLDNGIGMSEHTLTDHLLDFGRSFWRTDAVKEEFPGLLAKRFAPVGRFGVGFFSVFILGDVVRVSSRRFDSALDSTRTLEFRAGLELRPILRRATQEEIVHDGGTRVAVLLKQSPYAKGGFLTDVDFMEQVTRKSLARLVATLCPSSDVTVETKEHDGDELSVESGDWLRIPAEDFLSRVSGVEIREFQSVDTYASLVRPLTDGQQVYGRACARCYKYDFQGSLRGILTVGGFKAAEFPLIGGVLRGSTDVVTRNKATPIVPLSVLSKWAGEQVVLLSTSALSAEEKLRGVVVLMGFGAHPGDLPIAVRGREFLNLADLKILLADRDILHVHTGVTVEYDKDLDNCHERVFESDFHPDPDTLFLGTEALIYRQMSAWPAGHFPTEDGASPFSFMKMFRKILREVWGADFESYDSDEVVGHAEGDPVSRTVMVYDRRRSI